MDLITKIRKNTGVLHSAVEHSGILKRIVEGKASVDSYVEYLFNLSAMYKVIEETIESNKENEVIKEFVTPELYRYELIEKDLEYFLEGDLNKYELLASTVAFVEKVKELGNTNPELIVAYAYTRFIADLFGGRTFVSLLNVNYKVPQEGLNYYNCDSIKNIRAYVMDYATKINNINISPDFEEKLLVEVSNAYIYNLAISQELEAKLYLN